MHFLGTRRDVAGLIKRMRVQVLATRNEGLPLTLLEAMAGGCAVIGSDVPPVRTVLDGECGLLVPVGDAVALSRAMLRLVEDEKLAEDLRRRAMERVLLLYSSAAMARRYIQLYENVIAARGCAS
jgi:glycosyltransferase involved in cell wall biosynthesis